jgi:hypothetical protein
MFIKITWDEVGGRVGMNRGRKAAYFTWHFDGFPALIPWFSTGSMVSLIPSFITYHRDDPIGPVSRPRQSDNNSSGLVYISHVTHQSVTREPACIVREIAEGTDGSGYASFAVCRTIVMCYGLGFRDMSHYRMCYSLGLRPSASVQQFNNKYDNMRKRRKPR